MTAHPDDWVLWADGLTREEAGRFVAKYVGKPWASDYSFEIEPSDSTPDTFRVRGRGMSSQPVRRFKGR